MHCARKPPRIQAHDVSENHGCREPLLLMRVCSYPLHELRTSALLDVWNSKCCFCVSLTRTCNSSSGQMSGLLAVKTRDCLWRIPFSLSKIHFCSDLPSTPQWQNMINHCVCLAWQWLLVQRFNVCPNSFQVRWREGLGVGGRGEILRSFVDMSRETCSHSTCTRGSSSRMKAARQAAGHRGKMCSS